MAVLVANTHTHLLDNLRYTLDACLFSIPSTPIDDGNISCSTNGACRSLKTSLSNDDLEPNPNKAWDYCAADDGNFMSQNQSSCRDCLRNSKEQAYMANCEPQPAPLPARIRVKKLTATSHHRSRSGLSSDAQRWRRVGPQRHGLFQNHRRHYRPGTRHQPRRAIRQAARARHCRHRRRRRVSVHDCRVSAHRALPPRAPSRQLVRPVRLGAAAQPVPLSDRLRRGVQGSLRAAVPRRPGVRGRWRREQPRQQREDDARHGHPAHGQPVPQRRHRAAQHARALRTRPKGLPAALADVHCHAGTDVRRRRKQPARRRRRASGPHAASQAEQRRRLLLW